MNDRVSVLMNSISIYTEQWEDYEHLSTIFSILVIGVLLAFAGLIIIALGRNKANDNTNIHQKKNDRMLFAIISIASMILPALIILYLYVFSMNTRKVAIYQGYIAYLESSLEQELGKKYLMYNTELIDQFLAGNTFKTNGYGPLVMSIVLALLFFCCFFVALFFLQKTINLSADLKLMNVNEINDKETFRFKNIMKSLPKKMKIISIIYMIMMVTILSLFLWFGTVLIIELISNDATRYMVEEYCRIQGS